MNPILSLNDIQMHVQNLFQQEDFNSEPLELYAPIEYTLRLGGKRIRPVMLLASCQMFGGDIRQANNAAIGIEVFHNFTLLHDDLMDQSPLRRGQETVYRKWGANAAVLSGDAMLIMAYQYIVRQTGISPSDSILMFNTMAQEVMQGQQYDINFENRSDVTTEEYLDMIYLKTAALFNGALRLGAMIGHAPQEALPHLFQFGKHLGLAFQIQDDLLDTYGDLSSFGKQPGQDIRDNKKTMLLITALNQASETQQKRLKELISNNDTSEHKVRQVKAIYDSLNIPTTMENLINKHYTQAAEALNAIPVSDNYRQPLLQLMQELLHRAN
ncbi:MAG: polyprenyl synthetase family protein [Bacteroidales bacterium]|nr:polyprenyl synthetase family protein [Bacteroidales bacterium]